MRHALKRSCLENSIRLRAFAKINLGLKFLAQTPRRLSRDPHHLPNIALHDRLEISLATGKKEIPLRVR